MAIYFEKLSIWSFKKNFTICHFLFDDEPLQAYCAAKKLGWRNFFPCGLRKTSSKHYQQAEGDQLDVISHCEMNFRNLKNAGFTDRILHT